MTLPAFFIFIEALRQIYTNNRYNQVIKGAIISRGQGTFRLKDIALDVGIKPKDVLRVLLDLRIKAKITYRFNADSG